LSIAKKTCNSIFCYAYYQATHSVLTYVDFKLSVKKRVEYVASTFLYCLIDTDTSSCWAIKELTRELWNRQYDEHGRRLWLEWMTMAKDVGIPLLTSAARTLRKRLYGILNAMKHRVSNGSAESLNRKIRLLRIKSR
jgi:hypothetical protein